MSQIQGEDGGGGDGEEVGDGGDDLDELGA